MSRIKQSSINESVIIEDGEALTSSRSVAYVFGKPHRSVLRTADQVNKRAAQNCATPNNRIKFYNSTYVNSQNHQTYRKVLMNKHAFLHVVMSFTGNEAFRFKEAYFIAFDNMEKQLEHPKMNKLEQRNKKTLQNKVDTLEPENYQLKHRQWYMDQTLQNVQQNMLPKAHAYEEEMTSKYVYPLSHLAERYGTDAMHMNLVLQKMGVIGKHSNRWYLTKDFRGEMYASHDISYVGEHGSSTDSGSLKWTQKGFDLIRTLLKLHYSVTELYQKGNDFNMKFLMYQEHHRYKITELGYKQLKQLNLMPKRDDK